VEDFIAQLVALLADDHESLVRHSVQALLEHRTPDVGGALERALATVPPGAVHDLIEALLLFEPWSAVDGRRRLLSRLLSHDRSCVRFRALTALAVELTAAVGPDVEIWLADERDPEVLATIVGAAGPSLTGDGLKERLTTLLENVDERVRANAVEALDRLGAAIPTERLDVLLEDPSHRVRANVIKFRWKNEPDAMKALVLAELDAADVKRQRCALYLLGVIRPFTEAPRLLCERLFDGSVNLRRLAARGLLALPDVVEAEPVVRAFLAETDAEVREHLVELIGTDRVPRAQVLDVLGASVRDRALEPERRATAARGLSEIGGVDVLPHVRAAVLDDDPRVRANAIEGMAAWGGQDACVVLEPLLVDPAPRVCANAALELYRLGSPAALPRLMAMLNSQDPRQQGCAAFALGEIGTPEVVGPLQEAYQALTSQIVSTDSQVYVRDSVSRALAKIGDGSSSS